MSDARWGDPREYGERDRDDGRPRVYDQRDRDDHDPRDGLMHDLDLPRGEERELVVDRDRVYELNGEDSRTLAAVGAFRVVPEHDLDIDHETLDHLRDEGLVDIVDLGDDERGVTLTKEGRAFSIRTPGSRGQGLAGVLCCRVRNDVGKHPHEGSQRTDEWQKRPEDHDPPPSDPGLFAGLLICWSRFALLPAHHLSSIGSITYVIDHVDPNRFRHLLGASSTLAWPTTPPSATSGGSTGCSIHRRVDGSA